MKSTNQNIDLDILILSYEEREKLNDLVIGCHYLKKDIEIDLITTQKKIKFLLCCGQNCSSIIDMKELKERTEYACYLLDCLISMYREKLE